MIRKFWNSLDELEKGAAIKTSKQIGTVVGIVFALIALVATLVFVPLLGFPLLGLALVGGVAWPLYYENLQNAQIDQERRERQAKFDKELQLKSNRELT
jgi:hypothetical protein